MTNLPKPKVGIIACSGEELPEGTVTRQAVLKVLNELRPGRTTSLCLPLFLAGDEGHRGFARHNPTIAVDGCPLRCAARATENYSARPVASLVVSELAAELGLGKPEGRRNLDEVGKRLVAETAERIAHLVDEIMSKNKSLAGAAPDETVANSANETITCSCGSGMPVYRLAIEGKMVEIVALPLIFCEFSEAGRSADAVLADELLAAVKIYNSVPPDAEQSWREAILQAYQREYAR